MPTTARKVALSGVTALLLLSSARAHAQDRSVFAGTRLGTNTHGEEIRVKREVGSLTGYDDRLQAIAVARMAGAEPAVVVKGVDRRWHALETTANFFGGGTSADNMWVRESFGLPSNTGIAGSRKKIEELDKRVRASSRDTRALEDLTRERLLHATLVLGVEEKEIAFIAYSSSRTAGKINITARLPDDVGGQHGPEGSASEGFELGRKTAIEIKLGMLEDTGEAAAVLFHEVSHRVDYDLTQVQASRYVSDTRRIFSSGRLFTEWLFKRKPDVLPRADAEIAADVADGAGGSTEARAYVRTFLAAIESGAPDLATSQLRTYAGGLTGDKTRRAKINPPTGAYVIAALKAELEMSYRKMSTSEKTAFDAAFAAIKQKYPQAWISGFDHATALPRR